MNEETQAWLDKAEEDWMSAEWLLREDSPVVTPALFHLQQAAEKWKQALRTFGNRIEARSIDDCGMLIVDF